MGSLVLTHGPFYRRGSSNVPDDGVRSVAYRILLAVEGTYLIGLGGLMVESLRCLDVRVDGYLFFYLFGALMCGKYSERMYYMTAMAFAYMPNY